MRLPWRTRPRSRLRFRFRLTVRRLMFLIVGVALCLFVAEEFQDGSPPRFVLRGIPARIERLRPGMTWEETHEILGLEKSWLREGTSAQPFVGEGNGHSLYENYILRPMRIVPGGTYRTKIGLVESPDTVQSTALIHLGYETDATSGLEDQRKTARLTHASFSRDGRTVADMYGSP